MTLNKRNAPPNLVARFALSGTHFCAKSMSNTLSNTMSFTLSSGRLIFRASTGQTAPHFRVKRGCILEGKSGLGL